MNPTRKSWYAVWKGLIGCPNCGTSNPDHSRPAFNMVGDRDRAQMRITGLRCKCCGFSEPNPPEQTPPPVPAPSIPFNHRGT